jgi:hypothetical protein
MTFREQQEKIYGYVVANYDDYLPSRLKNPTFTKEFLDFDKFTGSFTVFFDFSKIDFRQNEYRDDCEDSNYLSLTVYLVHRNNTSEALQADNLDAAYAFYKMVKDNPRLGAAETTSIDSIDFYKYVEGNKYLVISDITLSFLLGL